MAARDPPRSERTGTQRATLRYLRCHLETGCRAEGLQCRRETHGETSRLERHVTSPTAETQLAAPFLFTTRGEGTRL